MNLAYQNTLNFSLSSPSGYGEQGAGSLISNMANAITAIAGIALLIYLLYGGLLYITAGGDEKTLKSAQKTMTNAIIGIIIVALAYFLTAVVGGLLGYGDIFDLTFSGP